MGTQESKGTPVPYTAPDYDPDQSGRAPADKPADLASAAQPAAGRSGEREPQPYVDPSYDPNKG